MTRVGSDNRLGKRKRQVETVKWTFIIAGIVLWPLHAEAVELHCNHVDKGTAGLSHVPVVVRNTGAAAMTCTIQLAHWYSLSLEDALPGGRTVIDLWFNPKSGAYLILNDKQDNMPVEALWCGIAGRAFETRTALALDRSKGVAPKPETMHCAAVNDRLDCQRG